MISAHNYVIFKQVYGDIPVNVFFSKKRDDSVKSC